MSKELKVTDLRIGDKVRDKETGLEMVVTGMLWSKDAPLTDVTIYTRPAGPRVYRGTSWTKLELVERG